MQSQEKNTTLKSKGLERNSVSDWVAVALAITMCVGTATALAQAPTGAPSTPAAAPSNPAAQAPYLAAPAVPAAPQPLMADPFPAANPKDFTAATPTLATMNSFLNQVWGFDSGRIWRVMAIQPTEAPNVTRVLVYITSTALNSKPDSVTMYITPDGKHIIDGPSLVYFSATPYAETRALLRARANGAVRGAAGKDLMIVEFADLQCPYCKVAQTTMDQIVKDFPAAYVVFQQLPLVDIHASAFKAAAYGVCAQKQGDNAFFKYAAGVFDTQQGLTPATDDTLLKAAALRAGLDGDAIAACSKTQATKDIVNADIKLAEDVGINQTPVLVVNGRPISLTIPYDTIKQLIVFQAKLDGVATGAAADILAPTLPPQPTLSNLPK
jgi:protein-disulfide isomerase